MHNNLDYIILAMLSTFSFSRSSNFRSIQLNFTQEQWNDVQKSFYSKALKLGLTGRKFVYDQQMKYFDTLLSVVGGVDEQSKKLISSKIESLKSKLEKISKEIINDPDREKDRVELFAEMLDFIPASEQARTVRLNESKISDQDSLCDIYGLGYEFEELWKDYELAKRDMLDEIAYLKSQPFTLRDALKSVLSSEYIKYAWLNSEDYGDLANDIVTVNSNLALLGALVITLAFPLYAAGTYSEKVFLVFTIL